MLGNDFNTFLSPLSLLSHHLQDHLNGKQYLGWKAIREQYAKLQEKWSGPSKATSLPPPPPTEEGEAPAAAPTPRDRERSPRCVAGLMCSSCL